MPPCVTREMPFAGHPTLGSCAAGLRCGEKPKMEGVVRQECTVGIVDIDTSGPMPAFAAPKTTVAPRPDDKRQGMLAALDLKPARIVATALLSNGPVWQVFELKSADEVLAVDSSRIRYSQFP